MRCSCVLQRNNQKLMLKKIVEEKCVSIYLDTSRVKVYTLITCDNSFFILCRQADLGA